MPRLVRLFDDGLAHDAQPCDGGRRLDWVETHRVKTGTLSKVKLLDITLSILRKYKPVRNADFVI